MTKIAPFTKSVISKCHLTVSAIASKLGGTEAARASLTFEPFEFTGKTVCTRYALRYAWIAAYRRHSLCQH